MSFGTGDIFAGFYWGPRKESVGACADRLGSFFTELSALDPIFKSWKCIGDKRQAYDAAGDIEQVKIWLSKFGVHRRDDNDEVTPDLGFSNRFLTNNDDAPFALSVHCGGYSKWLRNRIVLSFPLKGASCDRILDPSTSIRLMEIAVRSWKPDRGLITAGGMLRPPDFSTDRSRDPGWITYLASLKYQRITKVDAPAQLVDLKGGQLLITAPHFFSANDTNGMASLSRVASLIHKTT